MDKNIKINSPRSIKVCKTNGIEPNELYFIDYSEYLNKHPEISNLPDDIKKYRFHLIERFRLKTIKMIKEKRQELIKSKQNKYINESGEYPSAKKRLEDKFNFINDFELKRNNMTFSEKMGSMYQKERENINRLKKKQKQNIEFMIENRMKAELINYNNIEKDRKLKENFEKKKKENFEKNFINKKIMEEKEQRRIFNVKEMMRRRVFKISTKHELLDKRRNKMLEEKKKYREFLLRKRTEELMKIYNHRSQLDLFRQEQEKKLIKQKLNNEEKEKKLEKRIKYLKQKRDEISFKKREKSEEIFLKTLEKKDQHLSQLIQKVNKKHADNLKKMQEYYKELDIKNKKYKSLNVTKRINQKFLLQTVEKKRQKKINDYFNETVKKEQNIIISKAKKMKKILNQKSHEEEFLELVKDHKNQIELKNKKRKIDLENKMEEMGNRITNYKREEEHKSLKKIQESFVKQMEKEFMNKRIRRIKAYKYELKEKEKEEKEKRIGLMKSEILKFQNEKKKLNIDLKNEKSSLINKFNKLAKSRSNAGSEIVKQLYPDDDELYRKIKKIQNIYKIGNLNKSVELKNKIQTTKNNSLRKKKEEEIEKKVEDFRRKLRESISRDIESERINESRRIKEYEDAPTINDKKIIEQRNKLERKEFRKKINELNENIEKYVADYKKKLLDETKLY